MKVGFESRVEEVRLIVKSNVKTRQATTTEREKLPTAAQLYVSDLPGLPSKSTLTLFAGNLPASPASSDSDAHLYFLMAQPRHIPNRKRLIIWLNGGPGCSSFDGALAENGPLRVNADGTLREVSPSWNEYATVIFLDQPAGTGFSYVTKSPTTELDTAADRVVEFLVNLYSIFPELETMDTYIAGESYAGQYIPYIASAILETKRIQPPLKGLMIGSGWISPKYQYPAYFDYLKEKGLVKKGSSGYTNLNKATEKCKQEFEKLEKQDPSMKGTVLVPVCEEILGAITDATKKDGLCMNQYDVTSYQQCGAEWPEEIKDVTTYLRRKDVMKALHAPPNAQWSQCSSTVGARFWTPGSIPAGSLLPKLLESVPILLFSGDKDLMCAGLGVERMIDNLQWGGNMGFNESETLDWTVDGQLVGTWRTARDLTYVKVLNSSHMIPRDQPIAAHDMLLRFLKVDTLHAAGPAARVPSRIGLEDDTVLGVTSPNGTTLLDVIPVDPESPLLDSTNNVEQGGLGKKLPQGSEEGFDLKHHEALYGPRRTIVLVLLLFVGGFGIWAWLKWRKRGRKDKYRKLKGKAATQRQEEEENSAAQNRGMRMETRSTMKSFDVDREERMETREIFDVGEEDEDEYDDEEQFYDDEGDLGRADTDLVWRDEKV